MNVRRDLIIVALRYLSETTNLISKPEPFEDLIGTIFTGKTYEQRTAEKIEGALSEISNTVKHANHIRSTRFKKTRLVK